VYEGPTAVNLQPTQPLPHPIGKPRVHRSRRFLHFVRHVRSARHARFSTKIARRRCIDVRDSDKNEPSTENRTFLYTPEGDGVESQNS